MTQKIFILLGILLSGVLGIFIYPTVLFHHHFPDMGILAWVYLIPLFLVLHSLKGFRFFAAAWVANAIGYAGTIYWFVVAMKNFGGLSLGAATAIFLLIIIILALFFGVALSLAFRLQRSLGWPLFILAPIFLVSFDFLRTYIPIGGFPWPMVAYSQGLYLSFFQWIDVTGVFGLSLLIFMVNTLLAEMILCWRLKETDVVLRRGITLVLLVLLSFYASIADQRDVDKNSQFVGTLPIALVQGNISQEMKWDPPTAHKNVATYLNLTRQAASLGAELAIWPETAYPYTVDLSNLSTARLFDAGFLPIPTLLGSVSQIPTLETEAPIIYNSALMVGRDGLVTGTYHKRHLVPFGEYVPLKKWLFFARRLTNSVGEFTRGEKSLLVSFKNFKLGSLICYEDIFPDISRTVVSAGADFLVNLTNDAWYGDSGALYQHLVFSQFRALENRRALVRATNTGMTALIDLHGRVFRFLEPFQEGALVWPMDIEKKDTFYTRFGDWVAWVCVGGALVSLLYAICHSERSPKA